jgi:hypothetical protein
MFRKLISSVSFSPALVNQLGFYAKRLRKEEATRRLGLVFTALALVVQSFVVFAPPEPANAASSNDMIRGGVRSTSDILSHYDRNTTNFRDALTAVGITRGELATLKSERIRSTDKNYISWGRNAQFSAAQGERKYDMPTSNGSTADFYARPLKLWGSYSTNIYVGYSAKVGWFGIMKDCGNLITQTYPPIQTCPPDSTGVYPNCKKKTWPSGTIGTYPNCNAPPEPAATCSQLQIIKSGDGLYRFNAAASVENGAKVRGYTYTVKNDGKEVYTQSQNSDQLTNFLDYEQSEPGRYTVTVQVSTSLGTRSSDDCGGSFTIAEPEKCDYNSNLLATNPECQPCPGDETIWVKDEICQGSLVQTKQAKNSSQSEIDATSATAKAGDRIVYVLTVTNEGLNIADADFTEDLKDVAEYATVIEPGGGSYDADKQELTWPRVALAPNETQSRMFTVALADEIPSAAQGVSNRASYDCTMTNTFGNSVSIDVDCPTEKQVESVATELPRTGATENVLFGAGLLSVVTYFYFRARHTKKEIRLIRRDLNTGTF